MENIENLKNEIVEGATEKANETVDAKVEVVKNEINDAIELKADATTVEELKAENVTLQKSMDDLASKMESISIPNNTNKMENTWKQWLKDAAQGALEAKDASFVSKNASSYEPSVGANSAPGREDRQSEIEFDPHQISLAGNLMARTGNGAAYRLNVGSLTTNGAGVKAQGAAFGQTTLGVDDEYIKYRTIGHILTVPKEDLNDTDMLQSYFQEDLMGYLTDALNSQILTGDGTGANIKGIEAWSAPKTEAAFDTFFGSAANGYGTAANEIDVINAAASALEGDNFMGQKVCFVHPSTIAKIQGLKASTNEYLLATAVDGTGNVKNFLGGVQLVSNSAVAAGEFYIYDMSALKFVTREGMSTEIGYTGDDWQRNNVSLKVYGRFAVVSGKPNGIANGTFANAIASLNA